MCLFLIISTYFLWNFPIFALSDSNSNPSLIEVIEDEESKIENDSIVKQSVEKGKELKKGESITLYKAVVGIAYPDFTDGTYTVADVEDFCTEHEQLVHQLKMEQVLLSKFIKLIILQLNLAVMMVYVKSRLIN